MVGAAEPEARRRRPLSQPLARQDRHPGRRADRGRAAVLVFRRWRAQHRRPSRLRPLHRAGRSRDRAAGRHTGRALDLRHPQCGGRDGRAQMAGAQGTSNTGADRRRHHGRELPALPASPLSLRRDHLHVAAARYARSLCRQVVEAPRHPGAAARQHRRGRAQRRYRHRRHDADRYRQPRGLGATRARPSSRSRAAKWIRRAGLGSTRS